MKSVFGLLLMFSSMLHLSAHLHIQVRYNSGWDLFLNDFEAGEFPSDAFPINVGPAAFSTAAPDPRYTNLFGVEGSAVWVLPQNEKAGVVFLGIGTEISSSTFVGNQVHLRLRAVNGPGDFVLYSSDSFGNPHVHMNSRDGLSSADALTLPAQSHLHLNWAFTKPGTYTIGFDAQGTLRQNQSLTNSPVTYFTFHVIQPTAPILQVLSYDRDSITYRISVDPHVQCRIETTSNLTDWVTSTNISSETGLATFSVSATSKNWIAFIRGVIQ